MDRLVFGLILIALGVVYYFVAGQETQSLPPQSGEEALEKWTAINHC
jgi:hypothetical protein